MVGWWVGWLAITGRKRVVAVDEIRWVQWNNPCRESYFVILSWSGSIISSSCSSIVGCWIWIPFMLKMTNLQLKCFLLEPSLFQSTPKVKYFLLMAQLFFYGEERQTSSCHGQHRMTTKDFIHPDPSTWYQRSHYVSISGVFFGRWSQLLTFEHGGISSIVQVCETIQKHRRMEQGTGSFEEKRVERSAFSLSWPKSITHHPNEVF